MFVPWLHLFVRKTKVPCYKHLHWKKNKLSCHIPLWEKQTIVNYYVHSFAKKSYYINFLEIQAYQTSPKSSLAKYILQEMLFRINNNCNENPIKQTENDLLNDEEERACMGTWHCWMFNHLQTCKTHSCWQNHLTFPQVVNCILH